MMSAVRTEGHMVVRRASDVECEGIGEDFFVAIGRWIQQENTVALMNREAAVPPKTS